MVSLVRILTLDISIELLFYINVHIGISDIVGSSTRMVCISTYLTRNNQICLQLSHNFPQFLFIVFATWALRAKRINDVNISGEFTVYYSQRINSSSSGAAYIRRWTEWALAQAMACRLFGTKPLPEPMLTYCKLDAITWTNADLLSISPSGTNFSEIRIEIQNFRWWKCTVTRTFWELASPPRLDLMG